ncbi:hypothetical protein VNO77_33187 [Canavalia gladiata]|uniref:Uncharacterized protein n=1 Tax=Canavalia gladiata TaxID=3824 RepID=A0AAN9PW56_CANGL
MKWEMNVGVLLSLILAHLSITLLVISPSRISPSLHQSTMISPRDGKMIRQRILAHSCLILRQSPEFGFRPNDPSNFGGHKHLCCLYTLYIDLEVQSG